MLTLLFRYYAEYPCVFNLRFFPFDDQTCKIEFKAEANTNKTMELVPAGVRYFGPEKLVEFVVTDIVMGKGKDKMSFFI